MLMRVQPLDSGDEAELEEIPQRILGAGLKPTSIVVAPNAEGPAEVKLEPHVPVLDEKLIPAYLTQAAIETQGYHHRYTAHTLFEHSRGKVKDITAHPPDINQR
jgi:hypothetical protein